MSTDRIPAITALRCPVCGSWKVREHRLVGFRPESPPDEARYICSEGHVFIAAPGADPLTPFTREHVSSARALVARSKQIIAQVRDLLSQSRRNRRIRH